MTQAQLPPLAVGGRRTPWIVGGMAALCLGGFGAAAATALAASHVAAGLALAILSFLLVGMGAGGIALWLADRVGETGHVLATDLDTRFLDGHGRANLEVRTHDVAAQADAV